MRDDKWLLSRLDFIWSNHFTDVPQINPVFIKFGRFARLRFGSIKMDPRSKKTYITITGMFKDLKVPQEVVDHTIAHELCHYAHGFSSPHSRLHRYPHEGGVIKKEIEKRGLIYLYKAYRQWIRSYREDLKEYYKRKRW
ncbi:MAG: hypothetical protein Q7S44_04150 [bacterium]|nr:hypothetical protein [bacterium]